MNRLSFLLLPAFALTLGSANAAEPGSSPMNVSYSITLLDGGKVMMTSTAVGLTGTTLAAGSATGEESKTACKFHGRDSESTLDNSLVVGDSVALTIIPATMDDGRVDAVISATVGHGERTGTTVFGGCALTKGISHVDAVTDEAILSVGESKSIDLGAGKTLVIRRQRI